MLTLRRDRLFLPWVVLAGACAVAMWALPSNETIPYHIAWIGVGFAFGFEAWAVIKAVGSIVVYAVVTGAILVSRAADGVIAWQETAEIPLMSMLLLVVVWNVVRRRVAFERLSAMAAKDAARAANRERVSRMTSHEMRTPATIASGYTDLLLAQETDPQRRADLEVISGELGRLVRASDRLVRMIWLPEQDHMQSVDLRALLDDTAERWRVLADRRWVVEADLGRIVCSPDRVRASLDTLIENAVRYTVAGDAIRILGSVVGDQTLIGVADSGPGLDEQLLRYIAQGRGDMTQHDGSYVAREPKAQTGLGLALVHDAAVARGGRLAAGRSAEGGALVVMVVPRKPVQSRTEVLRHVSQAQPGHTGSTSAPRVSARSTAP